MEVTEFIPENLRAVIFTKLADIAESLPYKEYKILQAEMNILRDYYGTLDGAYIMGQIAGRYRIELNLLKHGIPLDEVIELCEMTKEDIDNVEFYLGSYPV